MAPREPALLTAGSDRETALWSLVDDGDRKLGDRLTTFTKEGPSSTHHCCAFSPDGSLVVVAQLGPRFRLYREDGTLLPVEFVHSASVTVARFSPQGDRIISGSRDGRVWLWHLDGTLERKVSGHEGDISEVEMSADGQLILSSAQDGTARLWRRDGSPRMIYRHPETSRVSSACFSPDGTRVLTSSRHRTRLWFVDSEALIRFAEEHIQEELSAEEWDRFSDLIGPR